MSMLPLADIDVPANRKRPLDEARIRGLAESIREVGLLQPIVVTKGEDLVAGLHRKAACEILGWTEIPVIVIDLDEIRRELAEIDENLFRVDLTALQRAEQTARRKVIYEQLHPETKRGATGQRGIDPDSGSIPAFIDDTASRADLVDFIRSNAKPLLS